MASVGYTTAAAITALAGQLAVDLRTDDDDADALVADAVAYATGRIDFYCSRYAPADLAASQWVQDAAAFVAVRWLCMRRLNKVPKAVAVEWADREKELDLIREGKAVVPRAPGSRRPAAVTGHHIDLRRFNDQSRVDQTRSTGAAPKGYTQPTDPTAPDNR